MKGRSGFSSTETDTYSQTMAKDGVGVCFVCRGGDSIWKCVSSLYLAVQFFHRDEVQGLEGVSRWRDEIKADVDPGVVVVKQRAFDLQLFLEVVFKLGVDVVDNGFVTAETSNEDVRMSQGVKRSSDAFISNECCR